MANYITIIKFVAFSPESLYINKTLTSSIDIRGWILTIFCFMDSFLTLTLNRLRINARIRFYNKIRGRPMLLFRKLSQIASTQLTQPIKSTQSIKTFCHESFDWLQNLQFRIDREHQSALDMLTDARNKGERLAKVYKSKKLNRHDTQDRIVMRAIDIEKAQEKALKVAQKDSSELTKTFKR